MTEQPAPPGFDELPPLDLTASWCTCPDECVLEHHQEARL